MLTRRGAPAAAAAALAAILAAFSLFSSADAQSNLTISSPASLAAGSYVYDTLIISSTLTISGAVSISARSIFITSAGTINGNGGGFGPASSTTLTTAGPAWEGVTAASLSYWGSGGSHGGCSSSSQTWIASLGTFVMAPCSLAQTYGDFRKPLLPGSGGSSTVHSGGSGGAAVALIAPLVEIDGIVTVDGLAGQNSDGNVYEAGGGGAGGSIYIEAGTLRASSGTLSARGGNSGRDMRSSCTICAGAGGGGRVAVVVLSTFERAPLLVLVGGGTPFSASGAAQPAASSGTVWVGFRGVLGPDARAPNQMTFSCPLTNTTFAFSTASGSSFTLFNTPESPSACALPTLPAYANATSPDPVPGALSYVWHCAPGFFGTPLTWTRNTITNAWTSSSPSGISCSPCPANTYTTKNGTECAPCPPGMVRAAGAREGCRPANITASSLVVLSDTSLAPGTYSYDTVIIGARLQISGRVSISASIVHLLPTGIINGVGRGEMSGKGSAWFTMPAGGYPSRGTGGAHGGCGEAGGSWTSVCKAARQYGGAGMNAPFELGSGGHAPSCVASGGAGGAALFITAQSVWLDGQILMDGGEGSNAPAAHARATCDDASLRLLFDGTRDNTGQRATELTTFGAPVLSSAAFVPGIASSASLMLSNTASPATMSVNYHTATLPFLASSALPLTLAMWLRTDRSYSMAVAGLRGPTPSGGPLLLQLFVAVDGTVSAVVALPGALTLSSAAGAASANQWVHAAVAISDSAASASLYVNGVRVATVAGTSAPVGTVTHVVLGGAADGTRGFHGHIQDVRVYDRELFPADVATLVSQGVAPGHAPLLHHPFDGASTNIGRAVQTLASFGTVRFVRAAPAIPPTTAGAAFFSNPTTSASSSTNYFTSTTGLTSSFFTLSAWIYTPRSYYSTVLAMRSIAGTLGLHVDISTAGMITIWVSNSAWFYQTPTEFLPANTWTHLALACSLRNVITLYVNGMAVANSGPTASGISTNQLLIMGTSGDSARGFHGYLADVRVYDRALRPTEIAALLTSSPPAGGGGAGGSVAITAQRIFSHGGLVAARGGAGGEPYPSGASLGAGGSDGGGGGRIGITLRQGSADSSGLLLRLDVGGGLSPASSVADAASGGGSLRIRHAVGADTFTVASEAVALPYIAAGACPIGSTSTPFVGSVARTGVTGDFGAARSFATLSVRTCFACPPSSFAAMSTGVCTPCSAWALPRAGVDGCVLDVTAAVALPDDYVYAYSADAADGLATFSVTDSVVFVDDRVGTSQTAMSTASGTMTTPTSGFPAGNSARSLALWMRTSGSPNFQALAEWG
jgi:hypothetical protein